jgi:hypothetical protein
MIRSRERPILTGDRTCVPIAGTPEELAHRHTTESLLTRRWLRFLSLALAAHQLATGQGRDHGNDDFLRRIIWLRHSFGTYLRCIPEALFAFDDRIVVGIRGLRRRLTQSSGNAARTSGPVVCAGDLSCGFSGGHWDYAGARLDDPQAFSQCDLPCAAPPVPERHKTSWVSLRRQAGPASHSLQVPGIASRLLASLAVAEHTSTRIWPAVAWHETPRRDQNARPPALGSHL